MKGCQLNHDTHETKVVDTMLGEMVIYDHAKYMDNPGKYCPGQDDVSLTIDTTGKWSPFLTEVICMILEGGDKKLRFIDVGCHIGYFSKLASVMGYSVLAYEGNVPNLELAKRNVQEAQFKEIWFDEDVKPRKWCKACSIHKGVELLKIDVEGSEQYAIKYLEKMLVDTKNIIMEVSPVFNDSYPELVKRIVNHGFVARELDGSNFDFNYEFDQKDLWFKKI